jgi:hypothetical protein
MDVKVLRVSLRIINPEFLQISKVADPLLIEITDAQKHLT